MAEPKSWNATFGGKMKNLQCIATVGAILALAFGWAAGACAQNAVLTLHKGLSVTSSVYGGTSQNGQLLGDYDWKNDIVDVSNGGYTYNYMTPGNTNGAGFQQGTQVVSPADKKNGTMLWEYAPNGNATAKGYVSYLALSDATFADIKAGRATALHFNGPDDPRTIKRIGEEDFTMLVNEQPTVVHTIKVQGSANGIFWILDNPSLPMMIKGEMKWKWMITSISDSGSSGAQVVSTLKQTGKATTHSILFGSNSAVLGAEARPVLDSVTQYLKGAPSVRLEIQGHTDNMGGAAFNLPLSQRRADAVKAYFVAAGIDASRLTARGYGLTVPVAANTTPEGRAQNRRVVFKTL